MSQYEPVPGHLEPGCRKMGPAPVRTVTEVAGLGVPGSLNRRAFHEVSGVWVFAWWAVEAVWKAKTTCSTRGVLVGRNLI